MLFFEIAGQCQQIEGPKFTKSDLNTTGGIDPVFARPFEHFLLRGLGELGLPVQRLEGRLGERVPRAGADLEPQIGHNIGFQAPISTRSALAPSRA